MGSKRKELEELLERYPALREIEAEIDAAFEMMETAYASGNKLLVAGNGGSAADAEHIVGELMKGFKLQRHLPETMKDKLAAVDAQIGTELGVKIQGALPAIALSNHPALNTAFINDVEASMMFAQQINGYGRGGDVFLAITTSGNSKNVLYAAVMAKALGLKVIALTGGTGGRIKELADITVRVPETETYKIQELHLPIYHCWCLMLENAFFGSGE